MDNPVGYLYRVSRSKTRLPKRRHLRQVPDTGLPDVEPGLPDALERLSDSQRVAVVLVHGYGWAHAHVRRGLAKLKRSLKVDA